MREAQPVTIPGLPTALNWAVPPRSWQITDGGDLIGTADAQTDLFVDPGGQPPVLNAPRLLMPTHDDFILSASVTVDFTSTYDAGVLLVYGHEGLWAKLCFELSPQQQPTVVSVVTHDYSDNANAFSIEGQQVWLRVARLGSSFAFHASQDGSAWNLIRYFRLNATEPILTGFLIQSPTGTGCTARFAEITYRLERLQDIRSGI